MWKHLKNVQERNVTNMKIYLIVEKTKFSWDPYKIVTVALDENMAKILCETPNQQIIEIKGEIKHG